jgi:hypothetical protein
MAYTLYSASKSSTSLIQLKFEPICSFSRSASQSRFFYLQFGSGSNERHREAYPRRIPRYIELEPTPIHLRDRRAPQPFWLIGVLDHQYILGCVRSSIKQGVRYIRRHTLVGADSVVNDLSVLVTPNLQARLIQTRKTIRRVIGKPLTD